MKPIITILFFLAGWFTNDHVYGQTENIPKEITIKNSFLFGPTYYQGEDRLSKTKLRDALKSNPKAYSLYKQSTAPKVIANVLAVGSGFFLGFGLSVNSRESGGLGNDHLAIGAALLLPSILLDFNATKKRKKAIQIYNKGLENGSTGYMEQPQLLFTGNGICLTF